MQDFINMAMKDMKTWNANMPRIFAITREVNVHVLNEMTHMFKQFVDFGLGVLTGNPTAAGVPIANPPDLPKGNDFDLGKALADPFGMFLPKAYADTGQRNDFVGPKGEVSTYGDTIYQSPALAGPLNGRENAYLNQVRRSTNMKWISRELTLFAQGKHEHQNRSIIGDALLERYNHLKALADRRASGERNVSYEQYAPSAPPSAPVSVAQSEHDRWKTMIENNYLQYNQWRALRNELQRKLQAARNFKEKQDIRNRLKGLEKNISKKLKTVRMLLLRGQRHQNGQIVSTARKLYKAYGFR